MPTNKQRADRGWSIFQYYREHAGYEGEPDKDILPDVLADLMHFCDASDPHIGFDDALRVASMHHDGEVLNPELNSSVKKNEFHQLLPKGASVLLAHIGKLLHESADKDSRIFDLEKLVDLKCKALDALHDSTSN